VDYSSASVYAPLSSCWEYAVSLIRTRRGISWRAELLLDLMFIQRWLCLMPASCWDWWLACSSSLKMATKYFSETSVDFQRTTRHYIPDDRARLYLSKWFIFVERQSALNGTFIFELRSYVRAPIHFRTFRLHVSCKKEENCNFIRFVREWNMVLLWRKNIQGVITHCRRNSPTANYKTIKSRILRWEGNHFKEIGTARRIESYINRV
jgi:hypothetical protein